jgi:phosphopentomutase
LIANENQIGEEVCRNLMEEDATTGRKRRELKQEKHRLTAFSERLARLVEQIREGDNSEHGQSEPATYSNYTNDGMPDAPEVEDDDDVMIVDDRSRL